MVNGSLTYRDQYASGWHLHSCKYGYEWIRELQDKNHKFYISSGEPHQITSGLVDGWLARDAAVNAGIGPTPPDGYRLVDQDVDQPADGDLMWMLAWKEWTPRWTTGEFTRDYHYARKVDDFQKSAQNS